MWSKSRLALVRVRVKEKGPGVRLCLFLALPVLTGALLSWEPFLKRLPGERGKKIREAAEAALTALWAVEEQEPQTYVKVETEQEDGEVFVEVKTL